jgi:hypothetical protein
MIRRLLVAAFAVVTLLANVPARGAFTTVINSPPAIIASGSVFSTDTQINLYPGANAAALGKVIYLTGYDAPAQNVQLNFLGDNGWNFEAYTGSQLNVASGQVNTANLLGGYGTMSGGEVRTWHLSAKSRLEMSGGFALQIFTAGSIDAPDPDATEFVMTGGEVSILDVMFFRGAGFVELTGGEIGDDFEVGSVGIGANPDDPTGETVVGHSGRVTVRDGSIGERMVLYQGRTLDYSGGVIGDAIQAREGSRVNIRGTHFYIDGVELTLPANSELLIPQRDVTLTGLLADGQPFEFNLHSQAGQGDFFSPDATVAIMLVPEPGAVTLTAFLFVSLAMSSRRAAPAKREGNGSAASTRARPN